MDAPQLRSQSRAPMAASPPAGPKTPYWLRAIKLITQPLEYLEYYHDRYGDVFMVGGASAQPVAYVSHPAAIQAIFAAPPEQFRMGTGGQVLSFLLGDSSLLLLDGDRHQRQRKLLMPPFHGDRLKAYSHLFCDITRQVTSTWQVGQSVRARPVLQDVTLRVILKAVFGLSDGSRYHHLRHLLSALLESLGSPLSASLIFFPALRKDWGRWSPWGRFVRLKAQVDELIYDEIRERRADEGRSRSDILSLLLAARDEDGQPMTDQELRDELITLLLAGHETTASALCWALYWIHYLPEVQDQLRSELSRLGPQPDPAEIARLPYLTAVCQETLRIYPVTLTTGVRVLQSPMQVMDYHLNTGTVLFPCTYLVHHRDDLYPQPNEFRPERFLQRQFAAYEFMPFGGGHRYCIGAAFALLEMKLVVATLLQEWTLELRDRRPLKPVRRGLTVAPPGHLSFRVVPNPNPETP